MNDSDMQAELYLNWVQLMGEVGVAEAAAVPVWRQLAAGYREDGRFYHNLAHIRQTLRIAHNIHEEAAHFTAVQLALWFHDIVYDATQQDNEEKSAMAAAQALFAIDLSEVLIGEVVRLILLTKTHVAMEQDSNGRVVIDADLSGLGVSAEAYAAYSQAFRQDYAFVPDAVYRNGRIQILQHFLDRPTIYYTEPMRLMFEAQARQNIANELAMLTA
jgi:predicted metal-dependent HD superfamily phosphohydrolase